MSIFAVIGTPRGGGSQLASRLELQEGGELLSTHRDTFRGEALASAIDPPESVRRQRQRITCIPQGNNGYANFQMLQVIIQDCAENIFLKGGREFHAKNFVVLCSKIWGGGGGGDSI